MSQEPAWKRLVNPVLSELTAYTPAAGEFPVRLDANEAPDLLSASARQRLLDTARGVAWQRYPDASSRVLRQALAQRSGVAPEEILVGVGSDELIALLLTTFSRARAECPTVLSLTPTFVMYRMTARIHGHRVIEVPLDAGWDMNVDSMLKAVELAEPNLIFVASPNNPTGTMVSEDRLRSLIERARDSLVVIDEAYVDYASRDQFQLFRDYENVLLLRTLSKIGFAALRLGWLIARKEIVDEINKARLPYNIAVPTQTLASVVISELGNELSHIRDRVIEERNRVLKAVGRLPGVDPTPSEANFIWLRTDRPAEAIYESLKQHGVLVRSFHKHGGRLKHYLRITIGLAHENDRFLDALSEVL